jgi:serine O-acetyltransferase
MFARFKEDIQCVFNNDPAARSWVEVLLTYPGLHALWCHRVAHFLYRRQRFTLARLLSHLTRFFTGIEIHPGATIGRRVFIDHGMGIVIGETAEIGDDCLLYKGVVLGGTTLEKKKRHPTLGQGVVVGSNACILGAITIGAGARVGSGSVVVRDVPPGATVVGVPGKIVKKPAPGTVEERLHDKLAHADLPDPLIELLASWLRTLEKFEGRIQQLEAHHEIVSENLAQAFKEELPFLNGEQRKPENPEPGRADD